MTMTTKPKIIRRSPEIVSLPRNFRPEDISLKDLHHMSKDSFALWALTSGVQVDNNNIDFNFHRYLLPIYLDNSREIVWQKAAQLGATSYMLLRILWWLEKHQGRKAGLYFPTKEGVDNLSGDRLSPLIQSCPSLDAIANRGDKLSLRKIGKSSFYLYHLGGVASKDSVPLDFIAFDEVRLCNEQDIDQALERVSHSSYKNKVFMSTAGIPGQDISSRFDLGTQHIWMAKCGCPDGVDLARTFPHCVVDDPKRGLYLRCPKCKYVIKDPQNGRFIPHNPGATYRSYHVSQLTSKFISIEEIWDVYKRTTNIEEFYNAKLGIPYIDSDNQGVTRGQLEACIDPSLAWAAPGETQRTAMGVDQGGGYNMVVIADLDANGNRKRIRHVEIIEQSNPDYFQNGKKVSPFARLRHLMSEYNVGICVCDAMPNYNESLAFAQEFPGKVFLAWYQKDSKTAVQWGDRRKSKESVRKAGPLLKFKYTVALGRFLSLTLSLGEWAQGNVILPDPDRLVQMCFNEKTNVLSPESPARRLFDHNLRLIKRFRITNPETGEGKHEWIYAGGDPHLSHAWNYCNIALERLQRKAMFVFA